MEDITGKQLGPYQIITPLGEGGMAAVYKGYHPAMERHVALKILPRHFASDPQFVARFKQEAKVLAQLQHPHILPVFDFGESDGYTYLVMPFIKSGTLADLLKGEPLPFEQIRTIISQVGGALDYAHRRGLIHRDVKPSNVLLDESGNCLLSDFGLAKILEGNEKLTNSGAVIGTPAYMSPEQGLGEKLDARSDIYALGVILYEMVTGRPPYKAETPMAVMIKHISDPLPPPSTIRTDLPEEVEVVILKALAKNPDDRYKTAGALVEALQGALAKLEHIGSTTFRSSGAAVADMINPARAAETQAEASKELPAKKLTMPAARPWLVFSRRSAMLITIGLIVVATIVLFVSRTFSPSRLSQPTATDVLASTQVSQPILPSTKTVSANSLNGQAQAFAEPILNEIADRPPDFSDDFSTDKGWFEDRPPQYQAGALEVSDGVLRFRDVFGYLDAEPPASAVLASKKDFVIQFDTRLVNGERSSLQKFWFHIGRVANQDYLYEVNLFSHDQLWTFMDSQGERGFFEIATGNGDVRPLGEVNQVVMIVRGDQAALYLNGKPVAYYQDSGLDNSGGIRLSCWSSAKTTCEYDNVKIWNLQNGPTSTQPPTSASAETVGNDQARAFAEPILKAIAARPPDFADDFSAGDKGWRDGRPPAYQAGKMEIRDGVLRLSGVVGQLTALPSQWDAPSKDFVVQFDTRLVEGDASSSQGFFFNTFYQISISSRYPAWTFWGNQDPQTQALNGSGDVSPLGEVTKVIVIVLDDRAALYLNDKPVAYYQDSDLDNSGVMFLACNSHGTETTCEFDNVKFWSLKNVPGLP